MRMKQAEVSSFGFAYIDTHRYRGSVSEGNYWRMPLVKAGELGIRMHFPVERYLRVVAHID